jgi:hypothetical protein
MAGTTTKVLTCDNAPRKARHLRQEFPLIFLPLHEGLTYLMQLDGAKGILDVKAVEEDMRAPGHGHSNSGVEASDME